MRTAKKTVMRRQHREEIDKWTQHLMKSFDWNIYSESRAIFGEYGETGKPDPFQTPTG
jgi:hypothetical protein